MLQPLSVGAPSARTPATFNFPPAAPRRGAVSIRSAAALTHPAGTPGWLRQRLKFFVRAWSRPRFTHAWLARLVQPDLAPLWAAHPRLATKLQRPYLCAAWDVPERFAALMGHYDALQYLTAPEACAAIYRHGVGLLELATPASGRALEVRLFYRDQFEKEGELTLAVDDRATGLTLAGLTFCLFRHDAQRVLAIGGLQATPDPRTRGLIHDVAKEMHGLRPKAFALWCVQQLAAAWQVGQIQGIGDAQHIYRHRHKRRDFAASYDEFWLESDGRQLSGGGSWELPLQLRPRAREELKPSRRKAHERRYAMLATLQPQLLAAIAALAPGMAVAAAPRAVAARELVAPHHSF